MFHSQYSRDLSTSPPPSYPFSYSSAKSTLHPPYSQHGSFQALPAPAPDYTGQSLYLPPLPTTLPSMSPYDLGPMKSENPFEDEGMLGQYGMGYSSLAGMDVGDTYHDSNPHVSFSKPLLSLLLETFVFCFFNLILGFGICLFSDSDTFKFFRALANRRWEQTPSLSHSHSFERSGSPSLTFPGTPASMPDSPLLTIR